MIEVFCKDLHFGEKKSIGYLNDGRWRNMPRLHFRVWVMKFIIEPSHDTHLWTPASLRRRDRRKLPLRTSYIKRLGKKFPICPDYVNMPGVWDNKSEKILITWGGYRFGIDEYHDAKNEKIYTWKEII